MVFDVAHNPDGVKVLATALSEVFPGERFAVLLCVLADKDWRSMIQELAPIASHFVLTDAPTAPAGRRWDLAAAGQEAAQAGVSHEIISDFDAALNNARGRAERLIITGSFHTVGDAMSRLQVSPLPR
jgi:dihydrofolate synthase/folylpolyglutamate synthase